MRIGILSYEVGNLRSVYNAVKHSGGQPVLVATTEQMDDVDKLIVPGVGDFFNVMTKLRQRDLAQGIIRYAESGRELLGICVGMQILFDHGEESGGLPGLSLIAGSVKAIPTHGSENIAHKLPHIGWTSIARGNDRTGWDGTVLAGVREGEEFYFVHSYTAWPASEDTRLADADYNGCRISAVVRKENITGCQFHPERSATHGLKILHQFCRD